MEEGEVKVSKYNSGINIIMRLDTLWKDTHLYSRAGDYQKWNDTLDRIWVELARDLSDTEYKERKEEFDGFEGELSNLGELRTLNNKNGFKNNPEMKEKEKKNTEGHSKQYKKLIEKELFLRRLENHLGKGTAWDEGDEDDFE